MFTPRGLYDPQKGPASTPPPYRAHIARKRPGKETDSCHLPSASQLPASEQRAVMLGPEEMRTCRTGRGLSGGLLLE